MNAQKVIVIGINGHVGHHIAKAFVGAGWDVAGFGRSNKQPITGVRFIKGDAEDVEAMRAAIGDTEVVVNALNLPYHQWDQGRMDAQNQRVIAALGTSGKTLLFPRQYLQLRGRRPLRDARSQAAAADGAWRDPGAGRGHVPGRGATRRHPGDHPPGRRFLRAGEPFRLVRSRYAA